MYESFYNLHTNPFSLTPDPRFSFSHSSYKQAREYLEYALTLGEGFVMVTGCPGTGKTTLVETFLSTLDMGKVKAARIAASELDAENLLQAVAYAYGLGIEDSGKAPLRHLIRQFLEKQAQSGQRALLIVDEAQGLPHTALEELRLLADLHAGSKQLLQLFLVGQEQLTEQMLTPEMEHFQQRVIANYQLVPLGLQDTRDYVEYRLRQAGWQGDPALSGNAVMDIYRFSRGVPRHINKLCNRLLLRGYGLGSHDLDSDDVQAIAMEMDAERLRPLAAMQADNNAAEELLDIPELQQGSLTELAINAPEKPSVEHTIWLLPAAGDEFPQPVSSAVNSDADSSGVPVTSEEAHANTLPGKKPRGWTGWLAGRFDWQGKPVTSPAMLAAAVLSIAVVTGSHDNHDGRRMGVMSDASGLQSHLPVPADRERARPAQALVAEPASAETVYAGSIVTDDTVLQQVFKDELPGTAAGHPRYSAAPQLTYAESTGSPPAEAMQPTAGDGAGPVDGAIQDLAQMDESETGVVTSEPDPAEEISPSPDLVTNDGEQTVAALDAEVEDLLVQGNRALEDYRLLIPAQDSAYFYYQSTLRLSPDNAEARAGIGQIVERYVQLANEALVQQDSIKANRYIARGLSIQSDNSELLALKQRSDATVIRHAVSENEMQQADDQQQPQNFFARLMEFLPTDEQDSPGSAVTYYMTSSALYD